MNYQKTFFYINGFAISLAVKQRLMEQLGNYLFHVCPIFWKFHKNHSMQVLLRPSQPPLSLLYPVQLIFEFCRNFHFFNLQFSQKSQILPPLLLRFTNAVNFQMFCNFCKVCVQTWTYLIRSFQCNPAAVSNIWDTRSCKETGCVYSCCWVIPQ